MVKIVLAYWPNHRAKKLANFSEKTRKSAKLDYLKDLLEELMRKKRKCYFLQYVKTLEFIQEELDYPTFMYHGGMSQDEKDSTIKNFRRYKYSFDVTHGRWGGIKYSGSFNGNF